VSTLDRHACIRCGALLDYARLPGPQLFGVDAAYHYPHPVVGGRWAYCCPRCGHTYSGNGEPPRLRDVLDKDTVAALEADAVDAIRAATTHDPAYQADGGEG